MHIKRIIGFATLAVMLMTAAAGAHHAFSAEFDSNKPVMLEGALTKTEWTNPHAWIYIDVKGTDGKVLNWAIEMGPPSALLRRGWNRNSLPVGTKIKVQGFQAKDGSYRANGRDITFEDGSKLFVGSSGIGAPDERPE